MSNCPLCAPEHETRLWNDHECRVILVQDAHYGGFCRVIWQAHIKEMSDLSTAQQQHFMAVVLAVEEVLRAVLRPDKINLASLGNQVPHLHWHVIARFTDDTHFPDPVWAVARRAGQRHAADPALLAQQLRTRLGEPLHDAAV
jgi:diadenosine tetraphosphate (Ap4A) HIT family hydrolase